MSEVKIYTVVSDELSPPVIGESFCTDMVRHSDYAALEKNLTDLAVQLANAESKCRELAAENARAKKIISECREYFIAGVMNRIRPTNEGYLHMICDTFEDETPATDAFLAEVRASAVDEACLKISNAIVNCYQDEQVGLDAAATICGDLAAQLRQGAAL